jgi:hypothetical protein
MSARQPSGYVDRSARQRRIALADHHDVFADDDLTVVPTTPLTTEAIARFTVDADNCLIYRLLTSVP